MANVDLEKGERILGQGECMQMRGPLSVPGVLSLTDRRLVFVPDKLNKLIGMKQVTIRLESIKSYSLVGVDRALHVQGADDHWKFHGKWARTVHRRLKAFLEAGQEDQSSGEFGARERILLQAPADYFAKAVVTVGGDVIVTTRYLRFTPSAIERLMWRNLEIEVPIQDISNVQMNGPRRLTVTFGKTEHRFAGALVPRMYAALSAARLDGAGDIH